MFFTMEFVVYFVKTTETGRSAEVAQQQKIISKRFISNHCANQGVDEGERSEGSRVWRRPVWSGLQSLVKPFSRPTMQVLYRQGSQSSRGNRGKPIWI
jgi:hypothetical protein